MSGLLAIAGVIGGRVFFNIEDGHFYKIKSPTRLVCIDSSFPAGSYKHASTCTHRGPVIRQGVCSSTAKGHMGHPIPDVEDVFLNLFRWLLRILVSIHPLISEDSLLTRSLEEWPYEFVFNPAYVIRHHSYARTAAQLRYSVPERVENDGLVGERGLVLFRAAMAFFEANRARMLYWEIPAHRKSIHKTTFG